MLQLNAILAPLPLPSDPLSPNKEQIGNRDQRRSNTTKDSRSPVHSKFVVHRDDEQRKCAGERGSHKGIGCNCTCAIASERVDEIA